jgi:hypothetical protein
MAFCDSAIASRTKGDHERANALFRQAYNNEREAAELVAKETNLEPTRSVLLRSAASLALECGEHREAEKLIAVALAGYPPDEIAEELRDLFEQVNLGVNHLSNSKTPHSPPPEILVSPPTRRNSRNSNAEP